MLIKDKQTADLKRKAESLFAKGNLKKALEEYLKLRDLLPTDMRLVQKIGDIQHKLGNLDEAKKNYKVAAQYFTKEGYWAKAVALNKVIISIDPADFEVQKQISDIYTSKGLSSQKTVLKTKDIPPVEQSSNDAEGPQNAQYIAERDGWRIPLFSELKPEAMSELIDKLAVRRIPNNYAICKEGDDGRSMFVISEGWVEIFTESRSGKTILGSLKEGDFFGEFGLLTDGKRHASACAKSDVVLLEITSRHFHELAQKYPSVPKILDEYFRSRMVDNVLRKSKLFDSLYSEERYEILKKFKEARFEKNAFVFREGDPGDKFFFVKNGSIDVLIKRAADEVVVARLDAGGFFGEISLLTGKPRTASVRASSPLEVLYLDESSLKEILLSHPQIEKKLKEKMEKRAKDTIEAYQSHEEMKKCIGMV